MTMDLQQIQSLAANAKELAVLVKHCGVTEAIS
jgi:hypothetical protein